MNNLFSGDYKEWEHPFSRDVFGEMPMSLNRGGFKLLESGRGAANVVGIKEGAF
ncbi:hypothetical protein ACFL0P_02355 [Candidatus Omnitrophota bacterium]